MGYRGVMFRLNMRFRLDLISCLFLQTSQNHPCGGEEEEEEDTVFVNRLDQIAGLKCFSFFMASDFSSSSNLCVAFDSIQPKLDLFKFICRHIELKE